MNSWLNTKFCYNIIAESGPHSFW